MVLDIQFVKTAMTVSMERLDYTVHSLAAISSLYATDINGDLYGTKFKILRVHCNWISIPCSFRTHQGRYKIRHGDANSAHYKGD